jgi:hypothetical protein
VRFSQGDQKGIVYLLMPVAPSQDFSERLGAQFST